MDMPIKTILLADQDGRGLRPLTCDMPPAGLRLCGKPVFARLLDQLYRAGITQVQLVTGYLGHLLEEWLQRNPHPVEVTLVEECPILEEETLLICADTVTDIDFADLVAFHRQRRAGTTAVAPSGVQTGAVVDEEGRLKSPLQNTQDFGIQIFTPGPSRPEEPYAAYLYRFGGFCRRMVDFESYAACLQHVLARENTSMEHHIDAIDYHVLPPVYIGRQVQIGKGAMIGPGTCLEDGCVVGAGAKVAGSLVDTAAYIGDNASVQGAVIGHSASVKSGAVIGEQAVIGSGSIIGEGARVATGVKIWPEKTVADRAVVTDHLRFGGRQPMVFEETGFYGESAMVGETGVELTPEWCARLGAAIGSTGQMDAARRGQSLCRIAVGCEDEKGNVALALKMALSSGLLAAGAKVWDFGCVAPTAFDYLVGFSQADFGVYLTGGTTGTVRLVELTGRVQALERDIEYRLSSGDLFRTRWQQIHPPVDMSGVRSAYSHYLAGLAGDLTGMTVDVRGCERQSILLLSMVLADAGAQTGENFRLHLGPGGRRLSLYDTTTGYIWPEQVIALNAIIDFQAGLDVDVPTDAPAALEQLARSYGRRLRLQPPGRPVAPWYRDGLMMGVRLLRYMADRKLTPARLLELLPPFAVTEKNILFTGSADDLISRLGEWAELDSQPAAHTLRIQKQDGVLFIRRPRSGKLLSIRSEARTPELAEELCGEIAHMLSGVLGNT